jgi:N-acetylglucosamine transport system permease protein
MKNRKIKSMGIHFLRVLPMRVVLLLFTALVLGPLIWTIMMSFKTSREILTNPWALPQGFALENYVNAFIKARMTDYFSNSVIIAIVSTLILMAVSVPAAYVLSRYTFKGRKLISNIYMAFIFVQGTYLMVPLFLQMMEFKMLDNRFWLCVVYAVVRFPFNIFLMSGFLRAIPVEYEEAAAIDGCNNFQTMTRIMLPMAKSGMVTVIMLALIAYWNEYPLALILIQTDAKKTLPIGLANLFEVQKFATDWGALFAALVIAMIPSGIVYLCGHKKLTSGLSVGGIKG